MGRPEASLLSTLVALAATSRRRRPRKKDGIGDGEAFQGISRDEMPAICRAVNCNVQFRGTMRPLEDILYKWLRCELGTTPPCRLTFGLSRIRTLEARRFGFR